MLNTIGALSRRCSLSVPWYLAAAAVGTDLAVSGNLLTWIGDPYVEDGGSIFLKIHPSSYLLAAAALARVGGGCQPLRKAWRIGWDDPCLTVFLACVSFCILYAAILTGCCTLIVYIDTFLPAGLLAVALHGASKIERWRLLRLLQAGFALNAALAVAEAAAQANLVPMYLNGGEYTAIASEFRPTALYDHPLTGGILTMIGLLLPVGRSSSLFVRIGYVALLSAGLIAFGGRAAACLTVLVMVLRWCPALVRDVMGRRVVPPAALAAVSVAVVAMPCLLLAAEATGLGGRLLGHLYWDDSAQVRLRQWHILDCLSATQVVFGATRSDLMALLVPLKLQWGVGVIENFWLLMFINLGLAGFPAFVSGLAALLLWCGRQTRGAAPYLVTSVILVASSSNSLGRKSNLLVLLVAAAAAAAGADWKAEWRAGRRCDSGASRTPRLLLPSSRGQLAGALPAASAGLAG